MRLLPLRNGPVGSHVASVMTDLSSAQLQNYLDESCERKSQNKGVKVTLIESTVPWLCNNSHYFSIQVSHDVHVASVWAQIPKTHIDILISTKTHTLIIKKKKRKCGIASAFGSKPSYPSLYLKCLKARFTTSWISPSKRGWRGICFDKKKEQGSLLDVWQRNSANTIVHRIQIWNL